MDRLRVLICDDEPGMRLGAARILRDFTVDVVEVQQQVGFEIEQADCGEAALQRIAQQPFDLLILDHKMPGLSGLDVLDRLATMNLDMLAIMITAYASIETAVLATKRGAYDFLAKPFTPDELRNTVRKAAVRKVLARQARKLAEERREVRLQYTRLLAHELQAPLNAIDGYLDMMAERVQGPEIASYDEMIANGQQRIESMWKLIRDLLDMTQIESGRRERRLGAVDLIEVAKTAIETARPFAQSHDVRLQLDISEAATMLADCRELEMIFNNLISNAIKYNRSGGSVTVSVRQEPRAITIRVQDTGIGIAEQDQERVFQEFSRVRNDHTRQITGSGLGLSIVKKIVSLYGGVVSAESELGRGSVFTVTLPVQP